VKNYKFELPKSGQKEHTIPDLSQNVKIFEFWVTRPTRGCQVKEECAGYKHVFSYRLTGTDGTDNPTDEIEIDQRIGLLTVTNKALIKKKYAITVDVLTTNGLKHKDQLHSIDITIEIVCGKDSTSLSFGGLSALNTQREGLPRVGKFYSSNPHCPVT
jgi:hypothetical protein